MRIKHGKKAEDSRTHFFWGGAYVCTSKQAAPYYIRSSEAPSTWATHSVSLADVEQVGALVVVLVTVSG